MSQDKKTAASASDPDPDPAHEPYGVPPPPYRPALPPRDSSFLSPFSPNATTAQQPSETFDPTFLERSVYDHDPRAASTDSLLPSYEEFGRRDARKLLLVYIHGFMGNESSFKSFPAHVHYFVSHLLGDTVAVHTKIYPRYRSRRSIDYARDAFSDWLAPHESPETDVILLGHSMGGLLAADIALLRPQSAADKKTYRHRILGLINFDVPFLGMHPGVVISGLGSIFRPSNKPQGYEAGSGIASRDSGLESPGVLSPVRSSTRSSATAQSSTSGSTSQLRLLSPKTNDPTFNPHFDNDVILPVRKKWEGAKYFLQKHSDDLAKATKALVTSHLEFGGAMADYKGLKNRYQKIRYLEDIDDTKEISQSEFRPPTRIRFVNYYTSSTGQIKPSKPSSRQAESALSPSVDNLSLSTGSRSPRISVENPEGEVVQMLSPQSELEFDKLDLQEHDERSNTDQDLPEMTHMDPRPESASSTHEGNPPTQEKDQQSGEDDPEKQAPDTSASDALQGLNLPEIPSEPSMPEVFDPSAYEDKDVRKLAQKEHARKMKAYTQSVKDRQKAIQERQKMIEKREKRLEKERKKAAKDEQKASKKKGKEAETKEDPERMVERDTPVAALGNKKEEATQSNSQIILTETKNSSKTGTTTTPARTGSMATSASGPQSQPIDDAALRRLSEELQAASGQVPGQVPGQENKPGRKLKFCRVPAKDRRGNKDPAWVKVHMEGMDEVQAHCGLFLDDAPHYEKFLYDVGNKIVEWVEHASEARSHRH